MSGKSTTFMNNESNRSLVCSLHFTTKPNAFRINSARPTKNLVVHFVVAVEHEKLNMWNRMWCAVAHLHDIRAFRRWNNAREGTPIKKTGRKGYCAVTSTTPIRALSVARFPGSYFFSRFTEKWKKMGFHCAVFHGFRELLPFCTKFFFSQHAGHI